MSTTAWLLALAYGVDDPLGVVAAAEGDFGGRSALWAWEHDPAAHVGCNIATFCRNPLHPGPCKGWKHHLGLVSPGALHALEKARHDQLEVKRQAKVKALTDAGHAVPKHLQKPIVYDPAKSPFINNVEHGKVTPGLGIPTQGLTKEAAAAHLAKIPDKGAVNAKVEASQAAKAAEAAAAVKPHAEPQYLTLKQAGLKPGDKVFVHGHAAHGQFDYGGSKKKGAGPNAQLVTVAKAGTLHHVNFQGKSPAYELKDEHGNVISVGTHAAKFWMSPAPSHDFPSSPEPAAGVKVEATKMDNLAKSADHQDKGAKSAGVLEKVAKLGLGKSLSESEKSKMAMLAAKAHESGDIEKHAEATASQMAPKIATKLWDHGYHDHVSNHMHKAELEKALHDDIKEGVIHGGPTPVLDAAADAHKPLGFPEQGAVDKLTAEVFKKLGTKGSGPDVPDLGPGGGHKIDETHKFALESVANGSLDDPAHDNAVMNLALKTSPEHLNTLSEPDKKAFLSRLGAAHGRLDGKTGKTPEEHAKASAVAAKYEELAGKPIGNLSAPSGKSPIVVKTMHEPNYAPHVAEAVAMANGHKSATDTKKLVAFHGLTSDEIAQMDPNTQTLMKASATKMAQKFLAPAKKQQALDVLHKISVAQGGGAGAGGSVMHPNPGVTASHATKAEAGASFAKEIEKANGHLSYNQTPVQQVLHEAHTKGTIGPTAKALADILAKESLTQHAVNLPTGAVDKIHPHLAAEFEKGLKGESFEPGATPLTHGILNSKPGDSAPLISAVNAHTSLGPATTEPGGHLWDQVIEEHAGLAHAMAQDAGYSTAADKASFVQKHIVATKTHGVGKADADLAQGMAQHKLANVAAKLGLSHGDVAGGALEDKLKSDYAKALSVDYPVPDGVASSIDKIAEEVHLAGNDVAAKNGWDSHGAAATTYKKALFNAKIHEVLGSTPSAGAGGTSTHVSPAAAVIKGASPVGVGSGAGASIDHLSETQQKSLSGAFKAVPGTQLKDTPEHLYDVAVAVAAAAQKDPAAGKVSVLQVLKSVDEQHSKANGWANAGLLYEKIKNWLGTPSGKQYAMDHRTPKPDVYAMVDPNYHEPLKTSVPGGPGKFDASASGPWEAHHDSEALAEETAWRKEHGQLTPAQKGSITSYTSSSADVNAFLRTGVNESPQLIQKVNNIQSAMRPLQSNQLLLRGTGWEALPPGFRSAELAKKLVGKTITDKAFMSTSISGSGGHFSGEALQIEFQAPKGTMGVYVNPISAFHNTEHEMLLAAGTKWQILSVEPHGHQTKIVARIVS